MMHIFEILKNRISGKVIAPHFMICHRNLCLTTYSKRINSYIVKPRRNGVILRSYRYLQLYDDVGHLKKVNECENITLRKWAFQYYC